MFTIRNLGGVALLLAGSTWIWMTPAFASRGVSTSGVMWGLTQAMSLLTVAGFCVATWGLFARHPWWETVAIGASVVGLLAVVLFWVGRLVAPSASERLGARGAPAPLAAALQTCVLTLASWTC